MIQTRQQQQGVILLVALLMLLMMTTVVGSTTYLVTLGPRTQANAELKSLAFHNAQQALNEVAAKELHANACAKLHGYDPLAEAPDVCPSHPIAAGETRVKLIAKNAPVHRTGSSGGANTTTNDYFTVDVIREENGIRSRLRQTHYKTLWLGGDGGNGNSNNAMVEVGIKGS